MPSVTGAHFIPFLDAGIATDRLRNLCLPGGRDSSSRSESSIMSSSTRLGWASPSLMSPGTQSASRQIIAGVLKGRFAFLTFFRKNNGIIFSRAGAFVMLAYYRRTKAHVAAGALHIPNFFEKSTKRCGIVFLEVRAFQRYAVCLVWTMLH